MSHICRHSVLGLLRRKQEGRHQTVLRVTTSRFSARDTSNHAVPLHRSGSSCPLPAGGGIPAEAHRQAWIGVRMILIAVAIGAFAVLWFLPATSRADTPITSYSALPSTTQAGGHPNLEVQFAVKNRALQNSKSACNCEDAKNATFHLPAGFIGNPHATPQCTLAEFSAEECPIDSQVGIANVHASDNGEIPFDTAIYNLVPPPQDPGLLGFKIFIFNTPQFTVLSSRTGGDYGLDSTVTSIYHGAFPLESVRQVLWGVPADPSHDPLRINPAFNPNGIGNTSFIGELCDANGSKSTDDPSTIQKLCYLNFSGFPPSPSNSPLTPFLQNPTTCGSPAATSLQVLSYDGGTTEADYPWPQMTGCDQLSFNPSLYALPTTTATDTPSGVEVDLSVPQQLSPAVPSPTELRGATVTFPEGFSVNPNAADAKTACSDADARLGTEEEAQCPEYSKVGTLTIESSALPGPLPGYVYLGQPEPGNPYPIFLVANGFNTHIKLAGTVTPDPLTGQLTVSFKELPESPLTAFDMHFFGSERGLLATPTRCGTFPVSSTFTPWDASLAPQTSTQFFTLDSGPNGSPCPGPVRPFAPSFEAGVADKTAGLHSIFSLDLTRSDGDQNLTAVTVSTPPGFSATLAGIPYCTAAELSAAESTSHSGLEEEASPSCPSASQIGTAVTGAGAGTHPLYVPGNVYLSGPYKGAPLSLAVITPAVSGPYDLGNVVVRAALEINPETAQITAVSDPLPQILGGIPLRLRSILLVLDRPNFTLNPTNCDPFSVDAEVFGSEGSVAKPTDHFQVADCTDLSFAPRLTLTLSGATGRTGNPALQTTLRAKTGEANVSSAVVTLPKGELIDNAHIQSPCTRVQFDAGSVPGNRCPPGSVIGYAEAETPLLEKPLQGPVYLRSAPENKSGLPDIVAALNGQIDIVLDGKINSVRQGLRTTFATVPDAPVSKFTLSLDGGKRGLLINSTNLCKSSLTTLVTLGGQNGATDHQDQKLIAPCKSSPRRKGGPLRQRAGRR